MAGDKVIAYPKQSKLNIAIILLAVIFIYIVVCVFMFFSKERIVGYEVREGTLMGNTRHEAIVLRNERVVSSEKTGYVSFFATERERVGVGKLVYILDETGSILEYAETADLGDNSLSASDRESFRDVLDNFVKTYDTQDLNSLYQLDVRMENMTRKIANNNLLADISNVASLNGLVQYNYAPYAGNVAYWTDGLETMTANQVTKSTFDRTNYSLNYLSANSLVTAGEPVYKVYDSEQWSIAFPVSDSELAQRYLEKEVVMVRFLKNDISFWGTVSLIPNVDGDTVVVLSFQSGSVNFTDDRFVEVEIIVDDEEGLKIPVTSIAQKDFFLVPEAYVTYFEAEDVYYINVESYMEDGTKTIKRIEVTPYSLKDGKYYLDDVNLTLGCRLLMNDSTETYTVSEKASLTGVYNMNKGYAEFKQITVKKQNETYAIVESNTQYGLNVYDYIVLNAGAVSENDFIYE